MKNKTISVPLTVEFIDILSSTELLKLESRVEGFEAELVRDEFHKRMKFSQLQGITKIKSGRAAVRVNLTPEQEEKLAKWWDTQVYRNKILRNMKRKQIGLEEE